MLWKGDRRGCLGRNGSCGPSTCLTVPNVHPHRCRLGTSIAMGHCWQRVPHRGVTVGEPSCWMRCREGRGAGC